MLHPTRLVVDHCVTLWCELVASRQCAPMTGRSDASAFRFQAQSTGGHGGIVTDPKTA